METWTTTGLHLVSISPLAPMSPSGAQGTATTNNSCIFCILNAMCLLIVPIPKKRGEGSLQPAGVKKEEFWYESPENYTSCVKLCKTLTAVPLWARGSQEVTTLENPFLLKLTNLYLFRESWMRGRLSHTPCIHLQRGVRTAAGGAVPLVKGKGHSRWLWCATFPSD